MTSAGGASGSAAGGVGGGAGGSSNMAVHEIEDKLGSQAFKPHLKPGQLPGQVRILAGGHRCTEAPAMCETDALLRLRVWRVQETLRVAAWSVDDVARWLQVR